MEDLHEELLAELRAVRAELSLMRSRLDTLDGGAPSSGRRAGITRADAEQIGASLWTTVSQPKGPPVVVPVVRVPGTQDTRGDGDIAYRVERTDKLTAQGPAIWKRIDELFFTREEAEAATPGRRSSRTTGRQVR